MISESPSLHLVPASAEASIYMPSAMTRPDASVFDSGFWSKPINRLFLVMLISTAIHLVLWQYRQWIQVEPTIKAQPLPTLEVTLTAAPQPMAPAAPPAPPVSKAPPPPKPKPKPVVKPKPMAPKPEPEPIARKIEPVKPEPAKPSVAESAHSSSTPSAASTSSAARTDAAASSANAFESAKANAAYLHNPRPVYPELAKSREWEGRVLLKVQVLASGHAAIVTLAASSGHDILDEAALEAVRNWRFVPAKRGGQAVDSWVNVPINFNLN